MTWFWVLMMAGTGWLGYLWGRGERAVRRRPSKVWTLSEIEALRDRLNGDRVEIVDGAPWVYGRDFTMGDRYVTMFEDDLPKSSPEAVAEIIDSWGEGRAEWAASVGDAVDRQAQWDANPVYCNECGQRCETEWRLVSEYGLDGVFHPDCLAKARTRVTEQGLKRWPR